MASIARTESALEPLAINDNSSHNRVVPASLDIAIRLAAKLIEAGHSVDVGIMQINSGNFQSLGLKVHAALDPCNSIAAAATILADNFTGGDSHEDQQAALRVAISKYNTGNAQRGFDNGYVHKVEIAARRVVPAIDVGTDTARSDSAALGRTASSPPPDPNAPPSWDVWASFDYDVAHHKDSPVPAAKTVEPAQAAVSEASEGPSRPGDVQGPNQITRGNP